MKFCCKCNTTAPKKEFYKHKLTKDGLNSYCISCTRLAALQWAQDNPERANKKSRDWGKKNRHRTRIYTKTYRDRHPGFVYAHRKRFLKKYPWVNAANCMKRHAAKLHRIPPWADLDAIKFFYECCPAGCHVDHIIPLRPSCHLRPCPAPGT